jgi:hypothetical protein
VVVVVVAVAEVLVRVLEHYRGIHRHRIDSKVRGRGKGKRIQTSEDACVPLMGAYMRCVCPLLHLACLCTLSVCCVCMLSVRAYRS